MGKHTLEIVNYNHFKHILDKFIEENLIIMDNNNSDSYIEYVDNDIAVKKLYSNLIKDNLLKDKIQVDADIEELNEHEEMLADLKRKYKE